MIHGAATDVYSFLKQSIGFFSMRVDPVEHALFFGAEVCERRSAKYYD
jgi:hypothetical protein